MCLVIGFKVIVRVSDETLQFAGEQKVSDDVARVVGRVLVGTVTHGDGYRSSAWGCLELQVDRLEGLVLTLHTADGDGIQVVVVVVDEKQTVCQQMSFFIEYQ